MWPVQDLCDRSDFKFLVLELEINLTVTYFFKVYIMARYFKDVVLIIVGERTLTPKLEKV